MIATMKAFTERLPKKFGRIHTLRHGGWRAIYNETGDVALSGMIFGNEDFDKVKVYARRDKKALQKLAHVHWKRAESNAPQVDPGRKKTRSMSGSLEVLAEREGFNSFLLNFQQ